VSQSYCPLLPEDIYGFHWMLMSVHRNCDASASSLLLTFSTNLEALRNWLLSLVMILILILVTKVNRWS